MRELVEYPTEPALPPTRCLRLLYFYLPLVLTTACPTPALWCYARCLHRMGCYTLELRAYWLRRLHGAQLPPQQVLAQQSLHRLGQRLLRQRQVALGGNARAAADWRYTQHYLQRVMPLTERLLAEEEAQAGERVLYW